MNIERRLEIINDGKISQLAFAELQQVLSEAKRQKIVELAQLYRLGKFDHMELVTTLAEYCAYEDLEQGLIAKIKRGEKLSREFNKEQEDGN